MTVLTCNFGPLDVEFGEGVLTPRPWTLVQSARAAQRLAHVPGGPVLELHCGAGHIGQATAAWSRRHLVQLDDNPTCCEWAARNAHRNGVPASIICGDVDAVPVASARCALVLADPPYVPARETPLYPDDPRHAIDGGEDGLDGVRACLPTAERVLRPGGVLVLQVRGPRQAKLVDALTRADHTALEVIDVAVVSAQRAVVELLRV
ncbi:MAG TPA: methyltransferase domain-containing protein [Acidimicrobiia bacterium]|jgi:methylase of polypeptide subunit release factors